MIRKIGDTVVTPDGYGILVDISSQQAAVSFPEAGIIIYWEHEVKSLEQGEFNGIL